MASKISLLNEILNPAGGEEVPVAFQGGNARIKLSNLIKLTTKTTVGLPNVDNTSDLEKPVSNAQQTAINQRALAVHSHAESDITGLTAALAAKAPVTHSHAEGDVTGLTAALAGKAATTHSHAESDVTGLTAALAGKAATTHSHAQSDITGLTAALAGKAATTHSHTAADVTDLADVVAALVGTPQVTVGTFEW